MTIDDVTAFERQGELSEHAPSTLFPATAPAAALLRLHGWLSPSFPIGAYTYSHGLETLIEDGEVKAVEDLVDRIKGILSFGSGWTDGIICRAAMSATALGVQQHEKMLMLTAVADEAWSLRGSHELGFEATQQGEAFVQTVQKVWPSELLRDLHASVQRSGRELTWPVAFGVAASGLGAHQRDAVSLFLMAFVHNLISAAVRAVPLGQTDGQRAVALLEPVVVAQTEKILAVNVDDPTDIYELAGAAVAHDMASMRHETQFTRIFRS